MGRKHKRLPTPTENCCLLLPQDRLMRVLDRIIVTLMVAILVTISLPVIRVFHAPKPKRVVPPPRQEASPKPVSHERVLLT
jgi:hypothetical protein